MRILFLHEVGYFEKPVFEMHEFPEYLAKLGHQVGFMDYVEGSVVQASMKRTARVGKVIPDITINIYSQRAFLGGTFGRLIAALTFPLKFWRTVRDFQPEVVVSYAVPTTGWQALIISCRLGIPFVYRALDVSHKIRRTLFEPLVKVAEKFVCTQATWVSCNNPIMKKHCILMGSDANRTSVELPPLDLALFAGEGKGKILKPSLGITEHSKVILYMGSFFYFSGLRECIEELSVSTEKPLLVLVGGGEMDTELRDLVTTLKLDEWVKFTGFVEYEDLPDYFEIADVAINPMIPASVSNTALPNKVLQYMAAGLPVVSTRLEGLESVFGESSGLFYSSSPNDVFKTAVDILKHPNLLDFGHTNRQAVRAKFDISNNVSSFEKMLLRTGEK